MPSGAMPFPVEVEAATNSGKTNISCLPWAGEQGTALRRKRMGMASPRLMATRRIESLLRAAHGLGAATVQLLTAKRRCLGLCQGTSAQRMRMSLRVLKPVVKLGRRQDQQRMEAAVARACAGGRLSSRWSRPTRYR